MKIEMFMFLSIQSLKILNKMIKWTIKKPQDQTISSQSNVHFKAKYINDENLVLCKPAQLMWHIPLVSIDGFKNHILLQKINNVFIDICDLAEVYEKRSPLITSNNCSTVTDEPDFSHLCCSCRKAVMNFWWKTDTGTAKPLLSTFASFPWELLLSSQTPALLPQLPFCYYSNYLVILMWYF